MGAGLGRDKETPLPSLAPIGRQPPALAPVSKQPPAVSRQQPLAQRNVLGANVTAGADEAFDFSDEDDDAESSQEE